MNIFAFALWANFGNRLFVSAVMTFHAVAGFVEGHGDRAVLALKRLATGAAQDYRRISAAVEQNHGLLAAFQALGDLFYQRPGKELIIASSLELKLHVHDLNLRQGTPLHPLLQFN